MALQGTMTTFSGEIRRNQYIKILDVTVSKDSMRVLVGYYTNREYSDNAIPPYESTCYDKSLYILNGDNPLVQGYEFLKSEIHKDTLDV